MFKSVRPVLYTHHRRYSRSQLSPGDLTAHRRFHLVLLHSCPDTVHEFLLRKTQTSTPLTKGSSAVKCPGQDITPAGADCRYRAPLSPRLHGSFMTNLAVGRCEILPARLVSITGERHFVKAPASFSLACLSFVFFRSSRKKSFSIWEHSSPISPTSVSTWWLNPSW